MEHSTSSTTSEEKNTSSSKNTSKFIGIKQYFSNIPALITGIIGVIFIVGIILFYETHDGPDLGHKKYIHYWPHAVVFYDSWYDNWSPARELEYMEHRMNTMKARHDRMMEQAFDIFSSTDHYSIGNTGESVFSYTLSRQDDAIIGRVTSSNTGAIEKLFSDIQNLGFSVSSSGMGLSFSGNAGNIKGLMDILR